MSAMLRITTAKANTFTRAARTAVTTNAAAVKARASRSVTDPDGSGRSGWLTRSVSRSYRSFRALPPAGEDAAAAPASANGPAHSRHTQAYHKPARCALKVAKGFFQSEHYAEAVQAAKRAESIAIALDERFTGYQKSLQDLQVQIESMKKLGLDTDALEKVAGVAEEKVVAGIWENGAFVPNYMEGSGLLDKAIKEGRAFQEKAQIASNQIFVAELAIESVANLRVGGGEPGSEAFAHGAVSSLETALHDATKELALGNADGAATIARGPE